MISSYDLALIFERTEHALRQQLVVPLTPGRYSADGQLLCAGATLVHEALLLLRSPEEAQSFVNRVLNEGPTFIEDTGEKVGLDRQMVVRSKRINDSLDAADRLTGVMRSLRVLRQESTAAESVA